MDSDEWMLAPASARLARRQYLKALLRHHWMTAASWGIYLSMAALYFAFRMEPSEVPVKKVLALVQVLGSFVLLLVPVAVYMLSSVPLDAGPGIAGLAFRCLKLFGFYSLALWLIGYIGDELYTWVLSHPVDAAVIAVSLAIVWMIAHFSGAFPTSAESSARISGFVTAGPVETPTERDIQYAAAHEAGHALVYAALGRLPSDVMVVLHARSDAGGVLGCVSAIRDTHQLTEKAFAEWYMLVFLAGQLGESVLRGESTLGGSSDHQRWLEVARIYLSNHYRGVYYVAPQSMFEQAQNDAKLESLKVEQVAALRKFFDLNYEVFKQLADRLLEARLMGREQLIPFLRRVQLPPGFPLPLGPFKTFEAE
ncbi:hypothetical protein [Sinimarinibacterium sp. CAU 1509]|uniref:hypothetical protein n=1 Tax=Sinimarinibacterium sp. CAU 1509 TaxID=2562283 RepID=UPI00146B583C|nr:hypothetical protein [Sinimarinibacterium sp. CAU 1509]